MPIVAHIALEGSASVSDNCVITLSFNMYLWRYPVLLAASFGMLFDSFDRCLEARTENFFRTQSGNCPPASL